MILLHAARSFFIFEFGFYNFFCALNDFDQKAAEWDLNPVHLERSRAIADLLIKAIPMDESMTALEFGAGTGILSLMLKDHLGKITLMDSSEGMINKMREKLKSFPTTRLEPVCFDLETGCYTGEFDLIFTQMVLHHVRNINDILHKFNLLLRTGGFLAIADLYREDGSFHEEPFTGHHGFDPELLMHQLSSLSFRNINYQTCFVIKKETTQGHPKEYPVFLITACK